MTEDRACQVPLEEQRDNVLEHYDEISLKANEWHSVIPRAVRAYFDDLIRQRDFRPRRPPGEAPWPTDAPREPDGIAAKVRAETLAEVRKEIEEADALHWSGERMLSVTHLDLILDRLAEGEENDIAALFPVDGECANAHLIAAAPALYEALEKLADDHEYGATFTMRQCHLREARAALALACGESRE